MFMLGKQQKVPISEELFNARRDEAEAAYKSVAEQFCPYLGEKVHFNAKGLEHLKFKSRGKSRSREDQFARLRLLHLAPKVLQKSHTLQGVWETNLWESQKRHGHWEKVMKALKYFEFVAVIEKVRIKVIVKQVFGGELHFWSLIPFWRMNETTKAWRLHDGDPESE